MIELPLVVSMTVDNSPNEYELTVENTENTIPMTNNVVISVERTVPEYEGEYTVSASTDGDVVLETEGKKLSQNIKVNKLRKQTPQKPNINVVTSSGLINVSTTFLSGYNDSYTITTNTYQMETRGDRTITPKTREQTILTRGTYIIGDIKVKAIPTYDGGLEITPSDEQQVLETENLMVQGNIVVNPVPSNYGRIDWNGQFLTVS